MAEDSEIDPAAEGRRIVNKYLSEIGWAKELKRQTQRQLIPPIEKDVKMRRGDEIELAADEDFGAEIDRLRHEKDKLSKAILEEVYNQLKKRSDLSFFGKKIVNRLKENL